MAYPDEFSAAGKLQDRGRWWSALTEIGSKFGYYPEPTKIWLVVELCVLKKVESVYFGTKIKITTEGHRDLGKSIGRRKLMKS